MRIHFCSDIHLEFGKEKRMPPEHDVFIAAGDLAPGVVGVMWAAERGAVAREIITIAGNHEFYGRALEHHYGKLYEKARMMGTTFLQNDVKVIGNVRFIGATLWTDFNLDGNQVLNMIKAHGEMNDYKNIRVEKATRQTILPSHILNEYNKSKDFIQKTLETPFNGKTVVITHHAPSELSVDPRFRGSNDNYCYANRLENMILAYQPALWIHGHIHCTNDYMLGDTRVMSNPRGYAGHSLNPAYNPNLIIEI